MDNHESVVFSFMIQKFCSNDTLSHRTVLQAVVKTMHNYRIEYDNRELHEKGIFAHGKIA